MGKLVQKKIDQMQRALTRRTRGINPGEAQRLRESYSPCRCNGKVFATDGILMFAGRSKAQLAHCRMANVCKAIDDIDRSIDERPTEIDVAKFRARLAREKYIDVGRNFTAPRFDAKLVDKLLSGISGRVRAAIVEHGLGEHRPVLGFQATNGEWTAAVAGVRKGLSGGSPLELHEFAGRRRR